MITAVADVEIAVNCLAIGAADYVIKPYQLEDVRARVAQAMEKRRLILENRAYRESLEERVTQQARRLEELFLASVQSLAEALELRTRTRAATRCASATIPRPSRPRWDSVVRTFDRSSSAATCTTSVRSECASPFSTRLKRSPRRVRAHHDASVLGWRILAPLLGDTPAH